MGRAPSWPPEPMEDSLAGAPLAVPDECACEEDPEVVLVAEGAGLLVVAEWTLRRGWIYIAM